MKERVAGLPPAVAGALVTLVALAAYVPRMAPGLLWGDSAELQMAAWLAGLAHPTGYPLFLVVGWAWTHALVPLLSPAAALNLLALLFGALAAGGLAWFLASLPAPWWPDVSPGGRFLLAVGGALWFAFSPTFWSQALVAEVYTLHALFIVALLAAHARLLDAPPVAKERALSALALVYGLSLTHHRTTLLWLPGTLAFLSLMWPTWWRSGARLRRIALLAALSQLLYLYVPWRGPRTPYLHQSLGDGQTLTLYDGSWRAFLEHVTGSAFGSALGQVEPAARAAELARLWVENVTWPGLLLGVVGLWALARPGRQPWLALTGAAFVAHVAFGLVYGIGDIEVMLIPAWLVWILWGVLGAATWARRPRLAAVVILPLLLAGWQFAAWEAQLDRSGSRSARARWERILAAEPPEGAILVSNDRNEMVPLWYLQFVEGRRRDLLGLFPLITGQPEHANVARLVDYARTLSRPVVLIKPMPALEVRFSLRPLRDSLWLVEGDAAVPNRPPLEGDTAGPLALVSWEALPQRVESGGVVTVTLAWRVSTPPQADVTTFVHLVGADGRPLSQSDHVPGTPYYPPSLWPAGELILDRHQVRLPAAPLDQAVEVRAGLYRLADGEIVPLGRSLSVGWLLPEGAPFAPAPLTSREALASFVNGVRLDGAEVEVGGGRVRLRLTWRCVPPDGRDRCGPGNPWLFAHLVPGTAPAPPVAQYDGPVVSGYPLPAWPAGSSTTTTVELPLAPLGAREGSVWLGLYDPATGERVPLVTGQESVRVSTIPRAGTQGESSGGGP